MGDNNGRDSRGSISKGKDMVINSNSLAANHSFISSIGPTEEELIRLNIEERKRRRSGPIDNEFMVTDVGHGLVNLKSVLSAFDCTESSLHVLARLVKQASQPK